MKQFIWALWLISSVATASPLEWDGGQVQWQFSSAPLAQREPSITVDEHKVLDQAITLIKQTRFDDAAAALTLQLSRHPSAALWFALGQLYYQQQQTDAAINAFEQALILLPDFTRAHESLGVVLTLAERFTEARPHLQKAAAHGANAQTFALLGYGYLQTDHPYAASTAYSQAMLLGGDKPDWMRGLLHAHMALADYPRATALVEQLIGLSPDDPHLYQLRASLAQKQHNITQAISSLEVAYRLNHNQAIQWQLAQLYLNQGLYRLAQPHLLELMAHNTTIDVTQWLSVADYLVDQQQHTLADKVLDQLLARKQLAPADRSHALTSQAILALKHDRPSSHKPRQYLLEALELDPLNGRALLEIAALYEKGDVEKAQQYYRRAQAIPHVQQEALQYHAQLLLTQGAYQHALQLLHLALKNAPQDKRLQRNVEIVERMVHVQGK